MSSGYGSNDRRRKVDWDNGGRTKYTRNDGEYNTVEEELNPWTGMPYSQRYYRILETRTRLPVYQFKDELVKKIMENQCVVVEGETGKKQH
jgi:pre-mRNA-splicing factor ATP-dependent RNA helicase DHX15/PRP43